MHKERRGHVGIKKEQTETVELSVLNVKFVEIHFDGNFGIFFLKKKNYFVIFGSLFGIKKWGKKRLNSFFSQKIPFEVFSRSFEDFMAFLHFCDVLGAKEKLFQLISTIFCRYFALFPDISSYLLMWLNAIRGLYAMWEVDRNAVELVSGKERFLELKFCPKEGPS